MDTHSSFIPYEHSIVSVEKCLAFYVIFPAFFPGLTGWFSVCRGE